MLNGIYPVIALHVLALIWASTLYVPPTKIRWTALWFFQILVTEWIALSVLLSVILPCAHLSLLWFPGIVVFYILNRKNHLRTHNISLEVTTALKSLARESVKDFVANIFPFKCSAPPEKIQEPQQNLEHLYFRCENPKGLCIHIHGGAWKYDNASQLTFIANVFAQQDIEVISINYHKAPATQLADIVKSVERTFLFLKQQHSPSQKVILYGRSAGGHLSLMLSSLHPEMVDKVVALYPITNLLTMAEEPSNDLLNSPLLLEEVTGTTLKENPDLYRNLSPSYNQQNEAAPLLLVHGINDPVVSCEQSTGFYEVIRTSRRKVIYLGFEKGTHGFDALWNGLSMRSFRRVLVEFLRMKQF